jgi:cell division protein FtsI (penicillin-binding protein 3)
VPVSAERGSIFDRNGRDLAMSIGRTTVYADPTLVVDPVGEAPKLAPIVRINEQAVLAALTNKGTADQPNHFAYVAHTVSDATALAVTNLKLPGIGLMPESARSYPAGAVAGAIIGHVGTDGEGLDGSEYLYNALLAGKSGELVVERDPLGHDIPNTEKTKVKAQRGTDVVLTLDEDLQWEAEYSLLDQVKATGANGGMAAVVDVMNGDVLAMASVRGATGAEPARVSGPGEHNAPMTELFEPGSTNKLITMAWAIEHGHVTPATKFQVPYSIRVDTHVQPYYDAEPHLGVPNGIEHWTTADILRESSNVGTIMVAQRMKNQEVGDALRAFGLGQETAISWPGQPAGLLIPPSEYFATGKYSSAIGYGVAVTGMQMLDAFSTIANGGTTRPPRLLDATIDANGKRHETSPPPGVRVVSEATASTMTQMLEGVVARGTGACAAIPGYPVAGKTGTAKKALTQGGYSDNASMASFIGYAPADHPRFATIVVLDENNLRFGGEVAAPVFAEIMQFALTQYGVAATDPTDSQYNVSRTTAAAAGNTCLVPHGAELDHQLALQQQAALNAAQDKPAEPAQSDKPTHRRSPTAGSGTTADSLPADPSTHN